MVQRELNVIRILQTSQNIENKIKKSYRKIYPSVKWHPSVRDEQMPNFVSFFYDLIIALKYLPSLKQFVRAYMKNYYSKVLPEGIIYHTYIDRTSKAYQSLVRDLHFYFKLKESDYFDHVQLSYAYDIEAKQDLVVTLGDKKLGLQLFEGDDSQTKWKEKQAARRRIILGYPDYYMPLKGIDSKPVNIGTQRDEFFVYSDYDVRIVYHKLLDVSNVARHVERDSYILPKPVIKENGDSREKHDYDDIDHSYIYVGEKNILDDLDMIRILLQRGVRVEWVSPYPTVKRDLPTDLFGELLENLRLHEWLGANICRLQIYDGRYSKSQGDTLQDIGDNTTFNFEQYKTEHAPTKKHLIVEAGAGSGKTETMISRLIYLLHTKKLTKLENVVMITFTNEAADNIKTKLLKRLYQFYEITSNIRYIKWSEEVTSVRIMTIPSFAKTVIKDFSADLGLGNDFSIRTLTVDRRKIIDEELNEFVSKKGLSFKALGEIREYEWREIIDEFWNQLEKKGIPHDIQDRIEWGKTPEDKLAQRYFTMVKQVLSNCEQKFNDLKLRQNVFTVNDLTQKISEIQEIINIKQLSKPFKYLFVDEFQDTDDIQINLVITLINLIEAAQLFVVGDIKQSIYRFRGANYTAFDVLSKQLGVKNIDRDYRLKKNYRTNDEILDAIEDMFDIWRNDPDQILPKELVDCNNRLEPTVHYSKYKQPYHFEAVYNTRDYDYTSKIRNLYHSLKIDKEDEKENKPTVLAILVRTNYQARQIRDILEAMRTGLDKDIVYDVVTGGNLFSTTAARDLLILLTAFNYERDPESYFALYQTPFTPKPFNPVEFLPFEGNLDKFRTNHSFDEVDGFNETLAALRVKPPLHAIYQFIANNPFEKVLAAQNIQLHEIEKYRLNLYRILELATEEVGSGITSIQRLRDWLRQQVASNREEEEMQVDITNYNKLIKVVTVHKAKGLEFDTVFIPFTYQKFEKKTKKDMIVTKEKDKVKAGWKIEGSDDEETSVKSPLYIKLKENENIENIREEARLLYVALTRAKNRLVVIYNKSNSRKNERRNWSDLIRLGRGETV
ncbi:UvrD-helicase domain-containing protein [Neobacillus niacini]|uniref:UvrD-helicase domain-containing protein n=1 Tax=Neobacillus niacini TaxID=86668 RepID=UPI003983584A